MYKISIHLCVHTLLCARSFHPVQQLLNTHSFSIAMYCHQQRLRVKVCFPRTWNIKCRCYTNILEKQLSISTHKKIFRLNLFPSNKLNFLNFTKMAKEFYVQQNSFHVTSKYLEILTIWHFKRVVPRLCSPYQGGGEYLCQQAVLGDMPNKASKCICTSTVMVSADPLSFAPSTTSYEESG